MTWLSAVRRRPGLAARKRGTIDWEDQRPAHTWESDNDAQTNIPLYIFNSEGILTAETEISTQRVCIFYPSDSNATLCKQPLPVAPIKWMCVCAQTH